MLFQSKTPIYFIEIFKNPKIHMEAEKYPEEPKPL